MHLVAQLRAARSGLLADWAEFGSPEAGFDREGALSRVLSRLDAASSQVDALSLPRRSLGAQRLAAEYASLRRLVLRHACPPSGGLSIVDVEMLNDAVDAELATALEGLADGEGSPREPVQPSAILGAIPETVDGGGCAGIRVVCTDLAERQKEELRTALLSEAGEALTSSLDFETTLRRFAALLVPRLADWCFIGIQDPRGRVSVRVVENRNQSQAGEVLTALQGIAPTLDDSAGMPRVMESGKGRLLATADELIREYGRRPGEASLIRQLGMRSSITVPLAARGNTFGAITLATSESQRELSPADLEFAEELARQAALAIDNTRLYEEARQALAQRDELFAVATHELRSPLTAIQLKVALLKRDAARLPPGLGAEFERRADSLKAQVDRFVSLLEGMLDLSRIRNRSLQLDVQAFDLRDLIDDIGRRLAEQARAAGCELRISKSDPIIGYWDRLRLEQITTNLLTNAFKYGHGQPVEVSTRSEADQAILCVTDHGMGIDEADQARIFGRFVRATEAHRSSSLGLGLYIVREIVTAHGGTISVNSRPGEGATFTVVLPLRRMAPELRPAE